MSELGKCPHCGGEYVVTTQLLKFYQFRIYDEDGVVAARKREYISDDYEETVTCEDCQAVRPDLICRDGRIEKREDGGA